MAPKDIIMNHEKVHQHYVNLVAGRPDLIGLNGKKVQSVIQEPTWYKDNGRQQRSLCDLIFLHEDQSFTPVELKYSSNRRRKAVHQIHQGWNYGLHVLRQPFIRPGKIVFYENPLLNVEPVPLPSYYQDRTLIDALKTIYG